MRDMLNLLHQDEAARVPLDKERQRAAEAALSHILGEYGYCRNCARSCLSELLRERYADA
jgi:hypothetical protein